MDIPKEIADRFKTKRQPKSALPKPQCQDRLGDMSRYHDHKSNGVCILKNWSNSGVKR